MEANFSVRLPFEALGSHYPEEFRQPLRRTGAIDAAASRVDQCARILSPNSRTTAYANLLFAEEDAKNHDISARGNDYQALKKEVALQEKAASIRLRQERVADAQR